MCHYSSQPIFSVVIPVYNVARYLRQCLDSVLAQRFTNFEIICVDDGSPDDSVAIIASYDDARIRLVRQENRGLAAARNTGINASRGIYLALLDADDFWHPDKLSKHYRHLQLHPEIAISYSASAFVDEAGKALGIGQHPKCEDVSAKDIFCRNPIGNGSAPVLRKSMLSRLAEAITANGERRMQYFDESMRQSEDVEFWLRAALKAQVKIGGIPEPLTYYRVNMSGLSANLEKQYQAWLYAVEKHRKLDPQFIQRWLPLASAYQLRYLARRAVQNRQSKTALSLWLRSILTSPRILFEEPGRCSVTFASALLSLLPKRWYEKLERVAMNYSRSVAA